MKAQYGVGWLKSPAWRMNRTETDRGPGKDPGRAKDMESTYLGDIDWKGKWNDSWVLKQNALDHGTKATLWILLNDRQRILEFAQHQNHVNRKYLDDHKGWWAVENLSISLMLVHIPTPSFHMNIRRDLSVLAFHLFDWLCLLCQGLM